MLPSHQGAWFQLGRKCSEKVQRRLSRTYLLTCAVLLPVTWAMAWEMFSNSTADSCYSFPLLRRANCDCQSAPCLWVCKLCVYVCTNFTELLKNANSSSCQLDPAPTALRETLSDLAAPIFRLINCSLALGIVTADLKMAAVAHV